MTVWRMDASVPSQVIWMNGVVAQFHKQFPQYKKTKVVVDGAWSAALLAGAVKG